MKIKYKCLKEINRENPCVIRLYDEGYFSNDKENWEYCILLGVNAIEKSFIAMNEQKYLYFVPDSDAEVISE